MRMLKIGFVYLNDKFKFNDKSRCALPEANANDILLTSLLSHPVLFYFY